MLCFCLIFDSGAAGKLLIVFISRYKHREYKFQAYIYKNRIRIPRKMVMLACLQCR